jgi:hypothetical protein
MRIAAGPVLTMKLKEQLNEAPMPMAGGQKLPAQIAEHI